MDKPALQNAEGPHYSCNLACQGLLFDTIRATSHLDRIDNSIGRNEIECARTAALLAVRLSDSLNVVDSYAIRGLKRARKANSATTESLFGNASEAAYKRSGYSSEAVLKTWHMLQRSNNPSSTSFPLTASTLVEQKQRLKALHMTGEIDASDHSLQLPVRDWDKSIDVIDEICIHMLSFRHRYLFSRLVRYRKDLDDTDCAMEPEKAELRRVLQMERVSFKNKYPALNAKAFPERNKSYVIFCTDAGFVGLAPPSTCQGDVIALLDQKTGPVILSPENGLHRFKGFAFLPTVSCVHPNEFVETDFRIA